VRVSLANNQSAVEPDGARLRRLVRSLARQEGTRGGEVSIVFVDDAFIRELNHRYLGVRRATDVIAFPLDEEVGDDGWDLIGEVYVSGERALAQARRHHVGLSNEVSRLVVHGVLHLLGYGDDTPSERRKMVRRQEAFLRKHAPLVAKVARRARQ
jgi:probable rRNA maturation factor